MSVGTQRSFQLSSCADAVLSPILIIIKIVWLKKWYVGSQATRHSSKTWIFFNTFFVSFVSQSVKSYCRWLGVSNVGRVPLQSLTLLSPTLFRFLPFNTFSPYRLYRACSIDLDWIWEKYSEKETGKKGKEIANDFLVLTHEQKIYPSVYILLLALLLPPYSHLVLLIRQKYFFSGFVQQLFLLPRKKEKYYILTLTIGLLFWNC